MMIKSTNFKHTDNYMSSIFTNEELTVLSLDDFHEIDGNYIYNYDNIDHKSCRISFGGQNNFIFIDTGIKVKNVNFDFRASNSTAFICSENTRANLMLGSSSIIYIGKKATFTNACNITAAEGCNVFVGEEFMAAENVYITNTDGYPIYDVMGKRVNPSKSIHIGDHVWIGRHSEVLKGVNICSGSVVGSRSVVTKSVPSNSICVGSPARIVKSNIHFGRYTTVKKEKEYYDNIPPPTLYPENSLGNIAVLDVIRTVTNSLLKPGIL